MDIAKCSLQTPYSSALCLSSSVTAQILSFLSVIGASLPCSCIMDLRGVDKFFTPDTQFAWIFDGAMLALVHSHYSTLHITARKSSSPPYGKLNKEGVIKLPATRLSPPLYTQILAQDLSDILGLLMPSKWIERFVLWIFQYLSETRDYYARIFIVATCILDIFNLLHTNECTVIL
jgi:hypothetical protein